MRSVYWNNGIKGKDFSYEEAVRIAKAGEGLLWLDVDIRQDQEMHRLVADFALHPSAANDWAASHQRPRIKDFGSYIYVLLSAISRIDHETEMADVLIFVGKNFVITAHNKDIAPLGHLFESTSQAGAAISKGREYLLFYIADSLVDTFFPAFDKIDSRVANVESRILMDNPRERVLNNLFQIKRQCLYMRKVLGPMRDVFSTLSRVDMQLINPEFRPYFMSIYDHILRLFDTVDTYRDILSSALEVYLSAQSNRMNEIMKTLTIIATIMMPLTVVTGIYGMNFDIPELRWKYGYHMVLIVMALISAGMLAWFRHRRWI